MAEQLKDLAKVANLGSRILEYNDLAGNTYGKLTVLNRNFDIRKRHVYYDCKCACGNLKTVEAGHLRDGHTTSCGCEKSPDLTGKVYGRLTVIRQDKSRTADNGGKCWWCKCECGKMKSVAGSHLKSGGVRSCGCIMRELRPTFNYKHGKSGTSEYSIYSGILARCYNPNATHYKNYGGRCIGVCDQWLGEDGFLNFFKDMGLQPSIHHQIDRIDNNGNYCPENCRWVLAKENARNRRNNKLYTYEGKTQCLSAWAEEKKINKNTLYTRISCGWSIMKALTKGIQKRTFK
jgi:hypothetical protein